MHQTHLLALHRTQREGSLGSDLTWYTCFFYTGIPDQQLPWCWQVARNLLAEPNNVPMRQGLGGLLVQAIDLVPMTCKRELENCCSPAPPLNSHVLASQKVVQQHRQHHLVHLKIENASITKEEYPMDGAWPGLSSHRRSGSVATASGSPSGSANDELDDFGHISSSHISHPPSGGNNKDVARIGSIRSLTKIPVDRGSSSWCWQSLQGFVVLIVSVCECESFCLKPRCAARGKEERKGRQAGTAGLGCSIASTHECGEDRMGQDWMLSSWLADSWSPAVWFQDQEQKLWSLCMLERFCTAIK